MHEAPSCLPQVERVKQFVKLSGCPMPCYWEDDSFDFDKFYIGSDEKPLQRAVWKNAGY